MKGKKIDFDALPSPGYVAANPPIISPPEKEFKLDNYIISFPSFIEHETYQCGSYYGIIFKIDKIKYDIIHNYLLGNRLLINGDNIGEWKDIPFKKETFSFLPKIINVKIL